MLLQKGQKIKLSDLTSSKQLSVSVSLEMKSGQADITCFGVDENNKLSDDRYFVFYNQTQSPEGALSMKLLSGCTEFYIDMQKLPAFIKKIVITVASDGEAAMNEIKTGKMLLKTESQTIAEYDFAGNEFSTQKAIILCEIYEKTGIWRMSPIANGFNGGLSALLAYYGGEEVSAPTAAKPAPAPTPDPPPVSTPSLVKTDPQKSAAPKQTKINLKKSGDSHKIDLSKHSGSIHVNLNWNQKQKTGFFGMTKSVDLDLACMYRLKSGHMGVIQALGNSFGSDKDLPFIKLDKDDRTGQSENGENMFFSKPELLDFVVVFAYIYEGVPNWRSTNASVVLHQAGSPDIEMQMDSANSNDRFCVIATMTNQKSELEVKRVEKYFKGHREIDQCYGFGFQWKAGRK